MRFLVGNVVYEFKVDQNDAVSPGINSVEFQLDFKCRKFHTHSRSPAMEHQYYLRFDLLGMETALSTLMSDALEQFDVPSHILDSMNTHLRFYIERLASRNPRRRGLAAVLEVREISQEKAEGIRTRMAERTREADRRTQVTREVEAAPKPAKRSAVEELRRERVEVEEEEEEERECGICLERMMGGEEVIKMPCGHVYHGVCILKWLDRNHFCPYCNFKLPC